MKYSTLCKWGLLAFAFIFSSCQQETLVAELPTYESGTVNVPSQFVLKGKEYATIHRWEEKDLTFELRQGRTMDENITATFVTDRKILEDLQQKYARKVGMNLYQLLPAECYDLPTAVKLSKGQASTSITLHIKDVPQGTFVLPLALKTSDRELGIQFVEVVKHPANDIDMTWTERTPDVMEPRLVAVIEATENDLRNVGNYMLYPKGKEQPDKKRPLFDMTVIFSANMNFNEISGRPELFYNQEVQRILTNRDIFIKPLQDKGIKVLLSVMPNRQGIGFANLDISGERRVIKDFAREMADAVKQYGLDGVMFDDEYANYPETPDAVQPGRPMVQMGSFHFLIQELRNLMPLQEGQAWKDRHNLITFYNIGFFSNSMGSEGWCLFSNNFAPIKANTGGWEDVKYGNKIRADKKALREWVKDPANEPVLNEIAQIKAGEIFDFIWNCNYLRGDDYNQSNSGRGTWIAGLDDQMAARKYGVASFEMSLGKVDGKIKHQQQFWGLSDWESGTPGRMETLTATIGKQKKSKETTLLLFNLQYQPSTWNNAPFTNLYLEDVKTFLNGLGNTNNPEVTFEGTNYETVIPTYLK